MIWGVDAWGGKWGVGSEFTAMSAGKSIQNTVSLGLSISKSVGYNVTVSNSVGLSEDLVSEYVDDPSGYRVFYAGGSSNAEDRVITTYSAAAAASSTYTSSTAGNTVWS